MLVLHPPVEAPIVRPFRYAGSPFAAGLHRGVDFATRAGARVRVPCDGRVAWAGPDGLTLLCDRRRVTLLPLAPSVALGAVVSAGEVAGVAGGEPLHLGVRRPGDPFGYEDPERFLRAAAPPVPVAPRPRVARPWRASPRPWRAAPRPWRGPPRPVSPRAAPADAPLAPWPAWAGVAALLAGAAGGGLRRRRRARTRAVPVRAGPRGVS